MWRRRNFRPACRFARATPHRALACAVIRSPRAANFTAEWRGSDILAVADGVVTFSGRHSSYGNMVDIDHGNGYMTRYAHNERNTVEPGTRVRAGEVIAKMGKTGRATGVHVHFEVWLNDRPVNPSSYLRTGTARG